MFLNYVVKRAAGEDITNLKCLVDVVAIVNGIHQSGDGVTMALIAHADQQTLKESFWNW
jgi:hypothetical protein